MPNCRQQFTSSCQMCCHLPLNKWPTLVSPHGSPLWLGLAVMVNATSILPCGPPAVTSLSLTSVLNTGQTEVLPQRSALSLAVARSYSAVDILSKDANMPQVPRTREFLAWQLPPTGQADPGYFYDAPSMQDRTFYSRFIHEHGCAPYGGGDKITICSTSSPLWRWREFGCQMGQATLSNEVIVSHKHYWIEIYTSIPDRHLYLRSNIKISVLQWSWRAASNVQNNGLLWIWKQHRTLSLRSSCKL